jgi:DNA-binding transcriptional MerR regulator
MRIGVLSARSGVSVPTIKYYLRERILPPGQATAPNQAVYGEAHLRRLRLIRALIEVGGLPVARAHEVLDAVDSEQMAPHDLLGAAHCAVSRSRGQQPDDPDWRAARAEAAELVRRRGWHVSPEAPALDQVADAIRAMRGLDQADLLGCLEVYADAAARVAAEEVAVVVARGEPARMVEGVVVGTVLGETLLAALRLLAQEDVSARTLGLAGGPDPEAEPGCGAGTAPAGMLQA